MSIHWEIHGSVGHLTLDRPEKANAYDRAHLESIEAAIEAMHPQVTVVVIHSNHKTVFCAGADLDEMKSATPTDAARLYSQTVFTKVARSPMVSIAVVDGWAIGGGCELALAADIRVTGHGAAFRLPETGLGIVPAAGGCTRLTELLGPSIAKQVIIAGQDIDHHAAVQWGLAIDGGQDPLATAIDLAKQISSKPAAAIANAKHIIDTRLEDLSLSRERAVQATLYAKRNAD